MVDCIKPDLFDGVSIQSKMNYEARQIGRQSIKSGKLLLKKLSQLACQTCVYEQKITN